LIASLATIFIFNILRPSLGHLHDVIESISHPVTDISTHQCSTGRTNPSANVRASYAASDGAYSRGHKCSAARTYCSADDTATKPS